MRITELLKLARNANLRTFRTIQKIIHTAIDIISRVVAVKPECCE